MRGADGNALGWRATAGWDVLARWADGLGRRQRAEPGRGLPRFAFYGRVSTEDWQDPESSRARQLQQAVMLTAGRGVIAAEFFDAGQISRIGDLDQDWCSACPTWARKRQSSMRTSSATLMSTTTSPFVCRSRAVGVNPRKKRRATVLSA